MKDPSDHPQRDRPRLRDAKAEAVLRAVESGSYRHIIALSTEQWSTVSKDSAIILRTILDILADEPIPARPMAQKGGDLGDGVEGTMPLRRITGLVRLVTRAILDETERVGKFSEPVFSAIFEEYLNVVARWFGFYIQAGRWTYAFNPHQSGDAPSIVAEHTYALYYSGSKQLKSAMHASDAIADLILTLWMSQDEKGAYHEQGDVRITAQCPFVSLLVRFCSNRTSEPMIGTKIACFPKRKRQRFLECSISRMERWKERRLQQLESHPFKHLHHIITLTNELLDVAGPQYRKDYFALQFPSFALDLCKQFNATETPIQIEVACSFLSAVLKNSADVRRRLVLELLPRGLLSVIVADLLSQGRDSPVRWKRWYPLGEETQTPLELLVGLSIEKDVCVAVSSAISAIQEIKVRRLRSSWAEIYWKPFVETVALYKLAWNEATEDGIAMCDNTTHDHGTKVTKGETRECSGCRARVYCSERCQKLDWEMVHRGECHAAKAARIDCEISNTWVSHPLRSFLLTLTQHFVLNYETGLPLDCGLLHCTAPNSWGGCLVFPIGKRSPGAVSRSNQTRTSILFFRTSMSPPICEPMHVDKVLRMEHNGRVVFSEPRFVDMLEEFRSVSSNEGEFMLPGEWIGDPLNEGVSKVWRVAMCSFPIGKDIAFCVGRYVVERATDMTRVRRLNGYVKVWERV